LERDVILEDLTSAEIEQRFTSEMIGTSFSGWMALCLHRFRGCQERLTALRHDAEGAITKVEAIPPEFAHERAAVASEYLRAFYERLVQAARSLQIVQLEIPKAELLPKSNLTQAKKLLPVIKDFRTELERTKEEARPSVELFERLEHLGGGGAPKCSSLMKGILKSPSE
jgi:hypothetical protein